MGNIVALTALDALQCRFCIITLAGEHRVVDKVEIEEIKSGSRSITISLYKKREADIAMRRYLETLSLSCSKPKQVIEDFWTSPSTHVFNEIAFSPLPLPSTTLNYWVGPTIKPQAGSWSRIEEFIVQVICDRDRTVVEYLLTFIAHMLQHPEEKPGVMIAMLGAQGTGKGAFFQLLSKIWSRSTLIVSDINQVIGQFNAILEHNFVVCMDEALFVGDKKSTERMKSLITEPRYMIEQKHEPSRVIDSYHRFFSASNNHHFASIDHDDRRMLFLRVSSTHQNDAVYFRCLFSEINDPAAIAAMVDDLSRRPLNSFDVRRRPRTAEHLNQKLQSLSGFDRYWNEVLQTGCFNELDYIPNASWSESMFISTKTLKDNYKQFDKSVGRYAALQNGEIHTSLKRLCPSAEKARLVIERKLLRGFQLPNIETARREFEGVIGSSISWD